MNTKGHVYIVSNKLYPENVYKIGMSKNIKQRLQSYGKDRKIHKLAEVSDCMGIERTLIEIFSRKFKLFRGKETFEGNLEEMKEIFERICFPEKDPFEVLRQKNIGMRPFVDKQDIYPISDEEECHTSLLSMGPRDLYRIGQFCFVDNNGLVEANEWLLAGNCRARVAVDLLYKDVFFEFLSPLPEGGYMCLAKEWKEYIPSKKKLMVSIDDDMRVDYFGKDKMEGYDDEIKCVLENLQNSYPCELVKYLHEDILYCSHVFGKRFSIERYVKGKTLKEFVGSRKEPINVIKRAYAAYMFRAQNWFGLLPLIRQRCGENTDVITHIFIAPKITLSGPPCFNKWDGLNTMYGYNDFSGENPVRYLEEYGVFDSYFVDIVVHYEDTHIPSFLPYPEFLEKQKSRVEQDPTKIAPVFVSFFDSSKPRSKQTHLETSKEVARATYLVDIKDCIYAKEGEDPQIKLYTLFEGWTEKDRDQYKERKKKEIQDFKREMGENDVERP